MTQYIITVRSSLWSRWWSWVSHACIPLCMLAVAVTLETSRTYSILILLSVFMWLPRRSEEFWKVTLHSWMPVQHHRWTSSLYFYKYWFMYEIISTQLPHAINEWLKWFQCMFLTCKIVLTLFMSIWCVTLWVSQFQADADKIMNSWFYIPSQFTK